MPFKSLTIDPAFPPDWRARIETVSPRLLYVLGDLAPDVDVRWTAKVNAAETFAELQLAHGEFQDRADLRAADFANRMVISSWSFPLWRRVLRAEMDASLRKVQADLASESAAELAGV